MCQAFKFVIKVVAGMCELDETDGGWETGTRAGQHHIASWNIRDKPCPSQFRSSAEHSGPTKVLMFPVVQRNLGNCRKPRNFPGRPKQNASPALSSFAINHCPPFRLGMDCDRSSLLNHEFPVPRFYPGHTTGSTNSTWGEHWTTLHYWTPPEIAATFRQYWDSTVTATDKSQPVASWAMIDGICGMINQEPPATLESHVRRIFDLGISLAHSFSTSSRPPPSDAHSSIRVFENVVFGEPDYLLRNRHTGQVTGICEAKSPWNVGPSEIDDVITS